MRIIFNAQVQGTAIGNLSSDTRQVKCVARKHKHKLTQSDYCHLECDTVVPEHTPPQDSDLTVESARHSVTYLDSIPRHIPEHNIPGRRHNNLKFRRYKSLFLFTEKTARNILYLQYSAFLSKGYVKDKMSSSPVTPLQRLKFTVTVKEDGFIRTRSNS